MKSVGKAIPHESAIGHVTGTAPFIDDLVARRDELYVGFVGSPVAAGRLVKINIPEDFSARNIFAFTAEDIDGLNSFGPHFHDEPFLAGEELLYHGQPVAVIAAASPEELQRARREVQVEAIAAEPILTIDDAIDAKRFIGPALRIHRGKAAVAIADAPHSLRGEFRCGGQEQLYLESQAAIAYPDEQDRLVIYSSTQNPTEIQAAVAEVLGLGQHEVVCICQRMGGAFGGKETQAAIPAMMAAIVAQKTGRAARVVYDKDDDMRVTGKRHAYLAKWQVGFSDQGEILGFTVDLFSNGGAAADLSMAVLERSMLHVDNGYFLPHVDIRGRVCFTNLPPNTAFRGFGGPQAMVMTENVVENIAKHLGTESLAVRRRNLYGDSGRDVTPYGQIFIRNNLPDIFSQLEETSEYQKRRREIDAMNASTKVAFRGLAMTPVKFGISFTTRFLNQGNALVNLYTDGTVQVSTGGTEMGQGLNTKIRQLVAEEFGLSCDRVRVMATSTEKNNNTSPTAASASTDLNGSAAINACRDIKERLRVFAARELASAEDGLTQSPNHIELEDGHVFDRRAPRRRIPFAELTRRARMDRVDLGARGFYATPGVDFNRATGRGTPFFYFTQGAAAAEVEIDRFTGQLAVRRVDLLIDIGRSINPGVDMGQITGGFIQGMGWATNEALTYSDTGELLSHSPTTYKIPATTDVPAVFNCNLFDATDNDQNIYSSKAVGEPPLMLAICVWAAARDAVAAAAEGKSFSMRLPATGEEILRCLAALERPSETRETAPPESLPTG